MTAKTAKRAEIAGVSSRILMGLLVGAALGLSGCADIDTMLFGGDNPPAAEETSADVAVVSSAPPSSPTASVPKTYQPDAGSLTPPVITVTPLSIEPGSDTGTAVSKTAAALRTKVSDLQVSIRKNAQQLAELRSTAANSASIYNECKAHIAARLQLGTTRGNPELVNTWNQAQTALDQLTVNINGLNALAKAVSADASTVHYTRDQIAATLNVSGAVDEDHRQLRVLEDETDQTVVLIDRLLQEVSDDIQRQTAYLANERANLTALATAIKSGELYGSDLGTQTMSASLAGGRFAAADSPLVVIHFDQSNVDYQQALYTALRQALQARPSASFSVVAVAPIKGSAGKVQLAQATAHRHAQQVMRTMTDMGVPTSRMSESSATDPAASASEVRVFIR